MSQLDPSRVYFQNVSIDNIDRSPEKCTLDGTAMVCALPFFRILEDRWRAARFEKKGSRRQNHAFDTVRLVKHVEEEEPKYRLPPYSLQVDLSSCRANLHPDLLRSVSFAFT